ncbi:MAG: 50S ribosomal protein L9 [Victivallaceae bacterium]
MANNVKLILLEDVESLGLAGTEVNVAAGFARNFLLPRGLAAKATAGTLRLLEARKTKIEAKRSEVLAAAQALAAKLAEVEISIAMQAAADEQLYGSVTNRTIAEKLAELGFAIDHARVRLEAPIKLLGSYVAEVKLHPSVSVPLKVWVVRA